MYPTTRSAPIATAAPASVRAMEEASIAAEDAETAAASEGATEGGTGGVGVTAPPAAHPTGARAPRPVRSRRHEELRRLRRHFFDERVKGNRYRVEQVVGQGASGLVVSARDTLTGAEVAVKRMQRGFDQIPIAVRILRELKFMRLLRGHDNIVEMRDLLVPAQPTSYNDIFAVLELMVCWDRLDNEQWGRRMIRQGGVPARRCLRATAKGCALGLDRGGQQTVLVCHMVRCMVQRVNLVSNR